MLLLAAIALRFALILRHNRSYSAPGFEVLLASCKAELRIRRRIAVVRFSGANAAAAYGVLRPRLLICPQHFETLSETKKHCVLLHELAHIKRGDTTVSLLVMLLGALHWFNPVVLLTLVLMRRDMEAFCDAAALKRLDEAGRCEYARTLLKLSENRHLRFNPTLPMSATSIKRRIIIVSRYRKITPLHTALALLLTLVIAAAGCTSAVETQSLQPSGTPASTSPAITQAGADASAIPSMGCAYIATEDGIAVVEQGATVVSGLSGSDGLEEQMWQIYR